MADYKTMGAMLLVLLLPIQSVWAATDARCKGLVGRQGYGPFDYRIRTEENLANIKRVEDFHFDKSHRLAAMRGDPRASFVWQNLDYTILAFPNHHPALFLMAIWEVQMKKSHPQVLQGLGNDPEYVPALCYFERALRFAPGDQNVYNALARAMHRAGQYEEAIENFNKVIKLAPRSASAHYNLGLAYYSAERYEESATSARKAYALGYKRTELRTRLQRKGHWK